MPRVPNGSKFDIVQKSDTGVLRRIWGGYSHLLTTRPLPTKVVLAAFIFFCSDTTTQFLLYERNNNPLRQDSGPSLFVWDSTRAFSGAAFGVVGTTWIHYWWGFLEGFVGRRIPAARHKLLNTLVKVIIDQGLASPLYIYTYYTLTNFGQNIHRCKSIEAARRSLHDVHTKASDMLIPTLLQHWRLWPAVHTCNFYFLPLQHRVLVQNTVLVGWSAYLSYLNNSDILMTPTEEIEVAIIRRDTKLRLLEKERVKLELQNKSISDTS